MRQQATLVLLRARTVLEIRGASWVSLVVVILTGLVGMTQAFSNGVLVLALLAVVFYEFQKRLDQGLPLMQMAALLGVLQWTVGPALSYGTNLVEGRYSMYVPEAEYFGYALPGTAAYVFGLLAIGSSVRQRELMRGVRREGFLRIGLLLNATAIVARFAAPMVPGGLAFAVHLLSQLGYVGTIYFLFSRSPYRWYCVVLSLLPLFKSSADSAMFHDVILWMGLVFCYWYGLRKHNGLGKAGLLTVVGLALFTIQAVKQDYRSKVWAGREASFVNEVMEFWSSGENRTSDDVLANVITRLNQGWIISAVLKNVPESEPYANGETIVDAFSAALLPRFLAADKAKAGGKVNFRRFTGLGLEEGTSMGVSPLGEAYANLGSMGGIVLMLGFGLLFSLSYALCLRYSLKHAAFLFWIPLIFYQAIKSETEFVTVLNQVTKGAVVAFGMHWLIMVKVLPNFLPKRRTRAVRRITYPAVEQGVTAGD